MSNGCSNIFRQTSSCGRLGIWWSKILKILSKKFTLLRASILYKDNIVGLKEKGERAALFAAIRYVVPPTEVMFYEFIETICIDASLAVSECSRFETKNRKTLYRSSSVSLNWPASIFIAPSNSVPWWSSISLRTVTNTLENWRIHFLVDSSDFFHYLLVYEIAHRPRLFEIRKSCPLSRSLWLKMNEEPFKLYVFYHVENHLIN